MLAGKVLKNEKFHALQILDPDIGTFSRARSFLLNYCNENELSRAWH